MVKCPVCFHLGMKIRKDKLICLWCGHEQKQLPEQNPEPEEFKDIKEYLD